MSGWFWFACAILVVFLVMELGGLALFGVKATLTDYVRASTKRQPILILIYGIIIGALALHFFGNGWCPS